MLVNGKILVIDRRVIKVLEEKNWYNKIKIGEQYLQRNILNLEKFFDAGFKFYVVDEKDKWVWNYIHNIIKRRVVEFEHASTYRHCYNAFDLNKNKYTDLAELERVQNNDILNVFKNSLIEHFEEFQYFIGLTVLPTACFEGSTVETLVLPETITCIQDRALAGTESLSYVFMPQNIECLHDNVFDGSGVKAIVFDGETCPEITEHTFDGIPDDCKIYVSKDFIRNWRSHDENWAKMKERLYPIDGYDDEFWEGLDDYFDECCDECCEAITIEELDAILV